MGIEEKEESEVKWVKHYSSNQSILLVGEGDFSFSLSLAQSFGSASNIVATSLDHPYDVVVKMYKDAKLNLKKLLKLGARILHGVDATRMQLHPDLKMQKFNRIIFNFPHAGFHGKEDNDRVIVKHKTLLLGFFKNACGMLQPYGEIHVSHKTSPPFSHWNIEELAQRYSLALFERVDFNIQDYAGYKNKRGQGKRCNEPFPLGECSTFKFGFHHALLRNSEVTSYFVRRSYRPYQYLDYSMHKQHQLSFLAEINDFMGHRPSHSEFRAVETRERHYGMYEAEASLAQHFQGHSMKSDYKPASFGTVNHPRSSNINVYEPYGYVGEPLRTSTRSESGLEEIMRKKIMFNGQNLDGRRLYELEIYMDVLAG